MERRSMSGVIRFLLCKFEWDLLHEYVGLSALKRNIFFQGYFENQSWAVYS